MLPTTRFLSAALQLRSNDADMAPPTGYMLRYTQRVVLVIVLSLTSN